MEGGGWRVEGGGWRVEGGGWRVEGSPGLAHLRVWRHSAHGSPQEVHHMPISVVQ